MEHRPEVQGHPVGQSPRSPGNLQGPLSRHPGAAAETGRMQGQLADLRAQVAAATAGADAGCHREGAEDRDRPSAGSAWVPPGARWPGRPSSTRSIHWPNARPCRPTPHAPNRSPCWSSTTPTRPEPRRWNRPRTITSTASAQRTREVVKAEWPGIGYHFVVAPDGVIYQGRQESTTDTMWGGGGAGRLRSA